MNPLLLGTVIAVLLDSVVTIAVGLHLNNTAEEKIKEGVENIIKEAPKLIAKAMTGGADDGED
jgi:hypothetical protein